MTDRYTSFRIGVATTSFVQQHRLLQKQKNTPENLSHVLKHVSSRLPLMSYMALNMLLHI